MVGPGERTVHAAQAARSERENCARGEADHCGRPPIHGYGGAGAEAQGHAASLLPSACMESLGLVAGGTGQGTPGQVTTPGY